MRIPNLISRSSTPQLDETFAERFAPKTCAEVGTPIGASSLTVKLSRYGYNIYSKDPPRRVREVKYV